MITNFDFPESDVSISIPASTSYDADLKHVEQVVLEVAFLVQNTLPIASKLLAPSMTFTSFGDSAVNFNVGLRVQRITDAAAMKHEFIKALHSRFQQERRGRDTRETPSTPRVGSTGAYVPQPG